MASFLDWLYDKTTLPVGDWLSLIPSGQGPSQNFNIGQTFQLPPMLTAPGTPPSPGPMADRGFMLPPFAPETRPEPTMPPIPMPAEARAPRDVTPFGPLSPDAYKEIFPNASSSGPVPPPFPKQPPMNADAAMKMPMGVFDPRNRLPGVPSGDLPAQKFGPAPGTLDMSHYQAAISSIESGSPEGNYAAVGPANKKGQRAYGR